MQKLSFAIIGAGPAAFYVAKCLSRLPQEPLLHIFEKQYCPFGLIRYGVAPDHLSIKKTENTLSSISEYPHFAYYGNTPVDTSLLALLKKQYSGVIYATGAQSNNVPPWMDLTREQMSEKRMLNARDIVYWYNNHPLYEQFALDLSSTRDVVIVGNGNVAIDISRILLKPHASLALTEISPNALDSLSRSKVCNVTLVARRGFTHSAFALKQLRQLAKSQVKIYCLEQELEESFNEASHIECTDIGNHHAAVVRMNKRKIDFVQNKCSVIKKADLPALYEISQKKVILRFLMDPITAKEGVLSCAVTRLSGEPFKQKAVRTEETIKVNFDLLVNSTGFKVDPIQQADFDARRNCISNSDGCLVRSNKVEVGQYAVGWCKTGPQGVIDQTLLSCEQTFNNIRIHINKEALLPKTIPERDDKGINFKRYLELKELELKRGDKELFIKKKLSYKEIVKFYQQ